jgi:hypothetical protein
VETTAASEFPPIRQAIREQLGLRLERTRAPVEVIVIEHVERPSENCDREKLATKVTKTISHVPRRCSGRPER